MKDTLRSRIQANFDAIRTERLRSALPPSHGPDKCELSARESQAMGAAYKYRKISRDDGACAAFVEPCSTGLDWY